MVERAVREKLLYVDAHYANSRGEIYIHGRERIKMIKSELESCFEITFMEDLTPLVMDVLLRVSKNGERFDALLTHFPYDKAEVVRRGNDDMEAFYRRVYGNSLQIIKRIRENHCSLPIVVYTGSSTGEKADPSTTVVCRILADSGADDFLFKSDDGFADAKKIRCSLEKAIQIRSTPAG